MAQIHDIRHHGHRPGSYTVVQRYGLRSHEAHRCSLVSGICTSFILELLVYAAIYAVWRERPLKQELGREEIVKVGYFGAAQESGDATALRFP